MKFGLIIKQPLISPEIKRKIQVRYAEHREIFLTNLLESGKKYRFKKGHYDRRYTSSDEIKKAISQLDKINSRIVKECPICNMKTKHYESHIYNAHGFLCVKRHGK